MVKRNPFHELGLPTDATKEEVLFGEILVHGIRLATKSKSFVSCKVIIEGLNRNRNEARDGGFVLMFFELVGYPLDSIIVLWILS